MSGTPGWTSQSMARSSGMSFRLDVRGPGDLGPACGFVVHPGEQFLRAVAAWENSEVARPGGELGRAHYRPHIVRQFLQHWARHAGRRHHGVEGDDVKAGKSFGDDWHLRRIGEAPGPGAG